MTGRRLGGAILLAVVVSAGLMAPSSAATSHSVSIQNYAFMPASLTINVGDSVTWTNNDVTTHRVASTSGPSSFDSGDLLPGQTYLHQFTVAGTYNYHCAIHTSMTASITVNGPAPPPSTAPPTPSATAIAPPAPAPSSHKAVVPSSRAAAPAMTMPMPTATATPTPTPTPSASATPEPSVSPASSDTGRSSGSSTWIWWLGGAAVAGVGAAALALRRRLRP